MNLPHVPCVREGAGLLSLLYVYLNRKAITGTLRIITVAIPG